MTEAKAAKPKRACAYSKADNVAATYFDFIALLLSIRMPAMARSFAPGGAQAAANAGMSTAPIEPLTEASPGAASSATTEKAAVITDTCNNHLAAICPVPRPAPFADGFEFHSAPFRQYVADEAFCCISVTFCPKQETLIEPHISLRNLAASLPVTVGLNRHEGSFSRS